MPNKMLTVSQAANHLGVSVSTIRRWDKSGELIPDIRDHKTGYRYYSPMTLELFKQKRFRTFSSNLSWTKDRKCNFTFIDLFAGIGGMRLPFEKYGGTCVFSSEIDKYAQKTYEYIFGEKPFGDINSISISDIPKHDILLAGFPCQPFSLAGVSKYESLGWEHGFRHQTKGTLFFKIAEILDYHRPHAFLLENVKNLKSHDKGRTWAIIHDTLANQLKYHVYAQIIDAKYLVPQHRERIFIVGFRKPLPFMWPDIPNLNPKLKDILDDEVEEKYTLSDHLWNYLQNYAEKHRKKGNGFGFGLVDPEGISRTLSARYHKDGSEILIPQKGKNPRRLTPAECARLMGFSQFDIRYEKPVVSDTQAYKQFGNAVVVPVVDYIAQKMLDTLYNFDLEFSKPHKTEEKMLEPSNV